MQNHTPPTEIAFIDGGLDDVNALIAGLAPDATYFVLDPSQDGVVQMANILAGYSNLNAIHVLSHGAAGSVRLGTAVLDQSSLSGYAGRLSTIGKSLSNSGDLLLYGCNVAQGDNAFMQQLQAITAADVAASTDLTGAAALAGDWTLEASAGTIETAAARASVNYILAADTFTGDGKVITDFWGTENSDDLGFSVTVQSDGKIVLAGSSYNGANYDFALVRYNSNGSLDSSFSLDGKLSTDFAGSDDFGTSVTVQSDGKIVLAGSSYNGSTNDFALVRYNSNGSLDNSFSLDGKLSTDFAGYNDFGTSVAVLSDGKLLLAGSSYNGSDDDFALVRYNSNGSLDNSFAFDGTVSTDLGSYDDFGHSVAVQSDGKIVLAGESGGDFALVRYNSNGSLDNSFSLDGKLTTDFAGYDDFGFSVTVQSDGKIVLAGSSDNGSNRNFALVRYNSDGSLDNNFAVNGKLSTDFAGDDDIGFSVTVQSDGKLVLAGVSYNGSNNDFALVRYNSNGSLDNSFSLDGTVSTDFAGYNDIGYSVTVQSDGKIVLAGMSYNGFNNDFALVRYNSNGSLDVNPVTVANHAPTGNVTISDTTPEQGQTLTAAHTLADADGLGVLHYQWKAGTTNLGTDKTYRVTTAEVGKTISVMVSYTDVLGTAERVASAATAAVAPVAAPPGFTLTALNGTATSEEGGQVKVAVSLNTQPLRDVAITFASSDTSEAVISGAKTLTFTVSNWNTLQTLIVTGVNDALYDGNVSYQITTAVNSIDVNYKLLTVAPIALTNTDNDAPVAGQEIYGDIGGSKTDILAGGDGADALYGLNMADDISGGNGHDALWGGYGQDNLFGDAGNDQLNGEQDADYLDGGAGNDTLDGGPGKDSMSGGAGNDTYILGYDATDIINDNGLPSDVDTVIMPYQLTSYTLPSGIENGLIAPGTGASNLTGNTGNNTLTGNVGNNELNGGLGRDALFGDVGKDTLIGGGGADRFDFNSAKETGLTRSTRDVISDFKTSQDDKIDLLNMDANTASAGNQAFTFVSAFSANATGQLRYDASAHVLYGSNDADTAPEFAIQLNGVAGLTASAFIL